MRKTTICFAFISLFSTFALENTVFRSAAGTFIYMCGRKVRAAQDAPLLKMEAAGDGRRMQKKITAVLAR